MKKLFILAMMTIFTFGNMAAQSAAERLDYKPAPYMFIGVQGGAQTTFTNFDQSKLITPTAAVSFGAFFTPVVGARLHVGGIWNEGGIRPNFKYDYKYLTSDIDLLINLCTLFGKQNYYPLNLYLIGGVGVNYAWDNDKLFTYGDVGSLPFAWKKNRLSHNARVGIMLDYNICKHLSVNLELNANSLSDRYNSKTNCSDDWQVNGLVGIAYKFGFKKKANESVVKEVVEEPIVEQPAQVIKPAETVRPTQQTAAVVTKPAVVTPPAPVAKPELRTEVFYEIRETVISKGEQAKFDNLVRFLKENPDTKVNVVGYADAGTGNDAINTRYARQRADNMVKALKNAGIPASRITSDSKGDNIQPYRENDKNRVVICVAK